MYSSTQPRWVAYAVAILASAAALFLTMEIEPLARRGSVSLFLAAIALATWNGGLGPGLLSIVLCAAASAYYMFEPVFSFSIANSDDVIRFGTFLLVSIMISSIAWARGRAEESFYRSEQRLRLALEAARMGAWDYNMRTGDFWWSKGMEQIFGQEPGRFSQSYESFFGYVHPQDRDFYLRAVTRTIEDGMDYEIEHRIVRPDQSIRWINTRGRIFYDDRGNAERMVGVVTDITEAKLAQDASAGAAPPATDAAPPSPPPTA